MPERVTAIGEATSLADRKRRAGQRLLIGLHGLAVDDDLRALVRILQPAGFLLFGRNVAEPAQVLDLTRELRDLVDDHFPAVIAIDQEGGRVQRVREPATVWPSAAEVAASAHTEAVGEALGNELRAMGIDLNLAPVADLLRDGAHDVIGDRAFGRRAEEVAQHVAAFVRGLSAARLQACLKHFPGHGAATVDSHEDLPVIELDRPELEALDLQPFWAGLQAGANAVLCAHALYPAWDEQHPATMSRRIQGILRARFDGLVLADDLEMGALTKRYVTEQIVDAMGWAGIDLLPIGHTAEVQHATFEALVRAQEDDTGFDKLAQTSLRRLTTFREQTFLKRPPAPPLHIVGSDAHRRLRDDVLLRARGRA